MIKRYLIILLVSISIDMFWHIFIATKLFRREIGHLMGEKAKLYPAFIFYLINTGAILVFVINPLLDKGTSLGLTAYGGFLGFAIYSSFNLTNLAILKNWSVKLSLLDLAWGSFSTAITALISGKIIQYM